jgi:RNase P subunit RPR2
MSKEKFTAEAALLWGAIPPEAQKRILKNTFCAKCNILVEIVNYYGTVKNGDLILDGTCAFCGHAAARVVEASQTSHENN